MKTRLEPEDWASPTKSIHLSLPEEIRRILAGLESECLYPAGIELFKQGSPAREVYVIDRGLVKLLYVDQSGQQLIVGLRFPSWFLGVASVILQRPYSITAVTVTPCNLCRIPTKLLLHIFETDLSFSKYLLEENSREVYECMSQLVTFGCLSARYRLEQLLWQMLTALGTSDLQFEVKFHPYLKHWEIARLIGVSPQHLSRLIKQMQQEQIIRLEKDWITVYKPCRLYHSKTV